MERSDSFTVCAFPESHRKDLQILGARSGRAGNKLASTGLILDDMALRFIQYERKGQPWPW